MKSEKDEGIFEAALEQLPEGVIIVDSGDNIFFVNNLAEKIRNITREEKIGEPVLLCHPDKSRERVKRALHYLKEGKQTTFTRKIHDQRMGRYYENTYSRIEYGPDKKVGTVVISKDVTETRKLEEERASYLRELQEKTIELSTKLQGLYVESMTSLVNTLEAKDPYTKGHSMRIGEISVRMAEHVMGISPELRDIELAGKLHDIGKVGVREAVLNKPDRLTQDEFEHMKSHAEIGWRILSPIDMLKNVAIFVRHHHERFDGKGYPDGLMGEKIPVCSRIMAIADTYDAMTSARPYREAMASEHAIDEIKKNLGTQFDSQWGKVFLDLFYTGVVG